MSALREETEYRILRFLEVNSRVNQRDLAETLGVSVGVVNQCLKSLLSRGLISVQNFKAGGSKSAYVYLPTPAGIAEKADLTTKFLKRKMAEYAHLGLEIEALRQEIGQAADSLADIL